MAETASDSTAGVMRLRSSHDHALRLPGGDWTVWRTAALRGAGFPASLVLALSSDRAAAAGHYYIERQADVRRCQAVALRELDDRSRAADSGARAKLRMIRRRLKREMVGHDGATPSEVALGSAIEARTAAYAALVTACESDTTLLDDRLRHILSDNRFREAVVWQNRHALSVAWRRLCHGQGSASDRRRVTEFVAMLVQRYSVKNDSVGFFGPVGWATLVDDPTHLTCNPGPTLTARREVYFEGWAIDALADTLNQSPALMPWMTPRLKPGVWFDAQAVYAPDHGHVPVSLQEHRLLRLCNGKSTARDIAAAILSAGDASADSEADVFAMLDRLVRLELVCWRLEVAPQLYPEHELASRLERIGDAAVRGPCLSALRQLVDARDRVADAAGQPAQLDAALEELESTFTRLTAQQPTRRHGQMYAARGLVYEDCQRACEVIMGGRLLARLGPPLSIVLNAARWVSVQWRDAFTRHLRQCHAELRESRGSAVLDAQVFVDRVIDAAGGASARAPRAKLLANVLDELRERFQNRWHTVLPVAEDARRVTCSVADLSARAADAFETRRCGSWAGYFSPDVLVSAPGVDAAGRGDCHFVLGEVHSGNTLLWSALSAQHPNPQSLGTALALDAHSDPVLVIQYPKKFLTARLDLVVAPSFWRYEQGDDLPSLPACRSLPAALLVAVDDGSTVRLRARDGSLTVDAYDLFAQFVHHEISDLIAEWLPATRHSPRVTIGDLTISRERWHVAANDLTFTREPDRYIRFARMRAWARDCGMPRQVFCRFPDEPKPFYLDFDSLVYSDIFIKLIKRLNDTKRVRLTEMLPGIDDTWLIDGQGARYTSELRIAARIGDGG